MAAVAAMDAKEFNGIFRSIFLHRAVQKKAEETCTLAITEAEVADSDLWS